MPRAYPHLPLFGGAGNDTFIVDDRRDKVIEVSGQGADTVLTSVSYVLDVTSEIETLNATGGAAINLTGNKSANMLIGNGAANKLYGGLGNDRLKGGAGKDTFVFNTKLGRNHVDEITDFKPGEDRIKLVDAVFSELDLGALAAAAFHSGSAAHDADDRIVWVAGHAIDREFAVTDAAQAVLILRLKLLGGSS